MKLYNLCNNTWWPIGWRIKMAPRIICLVHMYIHDVNTHRYNKAILRAISEKCHLA